MAPLALHHVGGGHVQTTVQARLHRAGVIGRGSGFGLGAGLRGVCLTLVHAVQATSAPQPNGKQNRQ